MRFLRNPGRSLLMASGRFVTDVSVDLPRPRVRSSRDFLALREQLLAQVLAGRFVKNTLR